MNVRVMGIVNVTPDSFSDGGEFFTPEAALKRAHRLVREGADILDFGGESTRPGATPITADEEWARLEPVLGRLEAAARAAVKVSVDTYHPETAARALACGADIVNCVYGETVAPMLELLRRYPLAQLVAPAAAVTPAMLAEWGARLYLDPMIGFGTTREEDLERLRSIPALARRGRVLVGVSRKRIVKKLLGEKVTGKDLAGNLALALWCARAGAGVLRVHDVGETVRALKVTEEVEGENEG